MNRPEEAAVLRNHGINPSAQRVAVAKYVLHTEEHPSADEVWTRVTRRFPYVSRATVYNTLNLFVEKGLLRQFVLAGGHAVFDPRTEDHHHLIDEETGEVHDVPWDAIRLSGQPRLDGFEIRDFQVILRGKRKKGGRGN